MSDFVTGLQLEVEIERAVQTSDLGKTLPNHICQMISSYCDVFIERLFSMPSGIIWNVIDFSGIYCQECGDAKKKWCDARWFLEPYYRDCSDGEIPKCSELVCRSCDYDIYLCDTFYTCPVHRLFDDETGQDLLMYIDVHYFSSDYDY